MSVGTRSVTLTVNAATKALTSSAYPFFRQLVTFTVVGAGNAAESLILLAYRGGEIVGICQGMTGTSNNAVGTMDLNTTELLAVMEDVGKGAPRTLELHLWNFQSLEAVAWGTMDVLGTGTYADVSTTPTSPISDATVFWGNLALYNGKTYLKNTTTGKYREISLVGTGDQTHQTMSDVEIDIPTGD